MGLRRVNVGDSSSHYGWGKECTERQKRGWKGKLALRKQGFEVHLFPLSVLSGPTAQGSGTQNPYPRVLSSILENESTASPPFSGISSKNGIRAWDVNIHSGI